MSTQQEAVKLNIFMDWIYNKPTNNKFSIRYWLYYWKFIKFLNYLKSCNPDFITLWHMANFIRLLKVTFFYRCTKKDLAVVDDIVSEVNYNGIIFYENNYSIEIRLSKLDKEIQIKVIDLLESKSRSEFSRISFTENTLLLDNPKDKAQFNYLNALITKRIADILLFYFKEKQL